MSEAIKDLLYRIADDELILGHRGSELTGLGPILEEDIAFSSIAQDQIGHALANYTILHEQFGEPEPDSIAFARGERLYKNSQFVELPIGEYDFSLMRHFLFDHSESCRYELLQSSSFTPLAALAKKIKGELKYHTLHADLWIAKLGNATEESHARMQSALNEAMPYALGIFEPSDYEGELIANGTFVGEKKLQAVWLERIMPVIERAHLALPDLSKIEPKFGGRHGYHTEYLLPLLDEMSEVYRFDSAAVW
ncbi:MAG TPA: 1,2-phenylacetyl-CoA epoxidase subunit PaaC [Candidatus Kapabacteria bacterium]|nr:1,2-phenylacetyl-CoA epoxidase subunit PaaC [Candidatus Kapabacteria bacterium]HYM34425.1 1,2-phenylacetyl-CoA epoxidase subunit PaaC [Steroidobacteraceae bacterium]